MARDSGAHWNRQPAYAAAAGVARKRDLGAARSPSWRNLACFLGDGWTCDFVSVATLVAHASLIKCEARIGWYTLGPVELSQ